MSVKRLLVKNTELEGKTHDSAQFEVEHQEQKTTFKPVDSNKEYFGDGWNTEV